MRIIHRSLVIARGVLDGKPPAALRLLDVSLIGCCQKRIAYDHDPQLPMTQTIFCFALTVSSQTLKVIGPRRQSFLSRHGAHCFVVDIAVASIDAGCRLASTVNERW
jgi:hypothetical protein